MGRENRRNRRERARQQRRQGHSEAPLSQIEFPGIMGWMQRNGRVLFLLGIMFMILSVGAGAFASGLGTSEPEAADPTETPESTQDPNATPTEEVIQRQYTAPPAMALDPAVDYQAVIHLEKGGEVTLDLLEEEAPGYVNNFVFLAQNRFYEGLRFHRVIPGFVAQAGDPTGSSRGGPGYYLAEETNDVAFEPGSLSMAKSSAGVSGSQFFITLGPTPHLDADFTVFGRVTEGMDALAGLTPRDPRQPGQPDGDVISDIEILEVEKPAAEATGTATGTPTGTASATETTTGTATPTATPTPAQ